MKPIRRVIPQATIVVGALLNASVYATPVQVTWSGEVATVAGSTLGDIGSPTVGASISGTFLYDTSNLPADSNNSPFARRFDPISSMTSSFTVGGVTTSVSNTNTDSLFAQHPLPGGNQIFDFQIEEGFNETVNPAPLREISVGRTFIQLARLGTVPGPDFNANPFSWDYVSPGAAAIESAVTINNRFITQDFDAGTPPDIDTLYDIRVNVLTASSSVDLSGAGLPDFIAFGSTETVDSGDLFNNEDIFTIAGTLTNDGRFFNDGGLLEITPTGLIDGGGALQQNDGSLVVNGVVDQDVTLYGGTLSGDGTINGDVFLHESEFTPGNSPGTFQVNGDFIALAGSLLQFEVGDLVQVIGSVQIDPGAIVEIIFGDETPPLAIDISQFFSVTNPDDPSADPVISFLTEDITVFFDDGSNPNNDPILVSGFGLQVQAAQDQTANASAVNILRNGVDAPEPGTLGLIVAGLAGLGYLNRRRNRSGSALQRQSSSRGRCI